MGMGARGCGHVGAVLVSLAFAATASAAPFGAATPIAGFGASPLLAGLSSAAAGADGSALIGATRSVGDGRQALVAEGRAGQPPVRTELSVECREHTPH